MTLARLVRFLLALVLFLRFFVASRHGIGSHSTEAESKQGIGATL